MARDAQETKKPLIQGLDHYYVAVLFINIKQIIKLVN